MFFHPCTSLQYSVFAATERTKVVPRRQHETRSESSSSSIILLDYVPEIDVVLKKKLISELPEFYFDEEKKKYFAIKKDTRL